MLVLVSATVLLAGGGGPIDFATIPREIARAPRFVTEEPRYGLFVFGRKGETRVWALLDKSRLEAADYDVLYLDLDADGDLTEDGERFLARRSQAANRRRGDQAESEPPYFEIGELKPPGTDKPHTEVRITPSATRVGWRMRWHGEEWTKGGYGPTKADYAPFAPSPKEAPIFVPGYDLPFQFEHWMSGTLKRGETTDFKVFVGNRGSGRGTFSAVDDTFLPKGEHLLATLIWKDASGQEQRARTRLEGRC